MTAPPPAAPPSLASSRGRPRAPFRPRTRPDPEGSIAVPVLAACLAAAGVPLYIHLPAYAAALGIGMGTLGGLLLALRLFDLLQDPLLGRIADRWPERRGTLAAAALAGMGLGMVALFTLRPGPVGLALALALVFTGFSLGSILFYGQAAERLRGAGAGAHLSLAGRRETGALAGILLAALLPGLLARGAPAPAGYGGFGLLVAGGAALALWLARGFWTLPGPAPRRPDPPRWRAILAGGGGALLGLALLNALPVAVTSTLFLFYVGDRLGLPGLAGPFLVLFFAAAGLSARAWARLAARAGAKPVLLGAMALALASFAWSAALPPGAALRFALICAASGLALGAEMVILPALFSRHLARRGLPAGAAFGAWNLVAKSALALAAAIALPMLERAGYRPGGPNDAAALAALGLAYGALPCALKLPAMVMVARLPADPGTGSASGGDPGTGGVPRAAAATGPQPQPQTQPKNRTEPRP